MNPCPNAASWNDGDGEADRPIPTPKRGLSGPANSGGQGQVELGRASGLVVGGLGIAEAEVFEDLSRGQAVLDDGNDLVASSALSALEDVDLEDTLEQGCPVEAVGSVLAAWRLWEVEGRLLGLRALLLRGRLRDDERPELGGKENRGPPRVADPVGRTVARPTRAIFINASNGISQPAGTMATAKRTGPFPRRSEG